MKYAMICLCMMLAFNANGFAADTQSAAIQKGSKVAFEYTLTVDGQVMESSVGKAPLEFTQGEGKIIPGLARQIEGMRAGEEKVIVVSPEEAYGIPDPKAFKMVQRSSLPAGIEIKVGTILQAKDAKGNVFFTKVAKVNKDAVLMDFNHPLAGKTLTFKVKIISVK